jgi:hypothetical protein
LIPASLNLTVTIQNFDHGFGLSNRFKQSLKAFLAGSIHGWGNLGETLGSPFSEPDWTPKIDFFAFISVPIRAHPWSE